MAAAPMPEGFTQTQKQRPATVGAVDGVVDLLLHHLKALQDRVVALEARPPSLKYCGTWAASDSYVSGDVVTHSGAMWVGLAPNCKGKPSESRDWQLCVQRGRDGKNAR